MAQRETMPAQAPWVQFQGGEDPPEEEMASPSRILAWKILRTKELGRLHTVPGVK